MADREPTWCRRADTLWRRSADAVVLLPAGADEPVVLPGTAAAVWDLLSVPATLDEIVRTLADAYGAEPSAVGPDVEELLGRLERLDAVARS